LDHQARFRLIDTFHAVLRLSVVLEGAKAQGAAGWTESVPREDVLKRWDSMQLHVGLRRVTREDVAAWLTEVDQARFEQSQKPLRPEGD
jgi:hypothetical protein